ncbi:MAG TPA: hypothetical protein VIM99_04560 [Blastocatellia bacterium]
MIPLRSQSGIRLRAALAAFLLLVGAIAPAARLWLPEPVTCGMACCEASGVCYCQHQHAGEAGASGADADTAKITAVVIGSSCPAQCAKLPSGFQKHSIARAHPPRSVFVAGATRQLFIHTPFLARDTLTAESHSPRAPPVILL